MIMISPSISAFGNVGPLFNLFSFLARIPVWVAIGQVHVFYQVCHRALIANVWPNFPAQVVILVFRHS